MNIDFQGNVAVVTGGAMGIGAATARVFCELGARVAVLDRDQEKGLAIVADLNARSHTASFHLCSIENFESVRARSTRLSIDTALFTRWRTAPASSVMAMW
jgi:3-oxoacyl-[acyl-carrier protein] reductase